ncbi:MAG: hypothetical protein H0W96_06925 [Solirubrobacterales bacterium]|nr:hypothetical protein [Solirubrobacterales bacterium]
MALVEAVGLGLAAGAIGTIALTAAEKAEMRLTGRQASMIPGQVAVKLTGRDPDRNPEAVKRLSPIMHWTHGIALGAVRGLLDVAGLSAVAATVVFVPLVWGGDALLYRALGVSPAPWKWERRALLTDLYGKAVLALATSGAYILLDSAI